jgi:hypothetical protein
MVWSSLKKGAKKVFLPAKKTPNYSIEPMDRDGNDVPDMLEPKKKGLLETPISKTDKKGYYVSTINYPLPPLSWEDKKFKENKKKRNGENKYL